MVDSHLHIEQCNTAAEIIFGYQATEILYQPFDMLLVDTYIEAFTHYVQEVTTNHDPQRSGTYFEAMARRRYGSIFPAEISIASIHYNGNIHYTIIVHDITGQKQAEEDLIASRDRINNILESITDAFFALDNDWRFVYVNSEAERIFRMPRQDLWEQCIWDVFPEALFSDMYTQCFRAVSEHTSVTFDTYYVPMGKWLEIHAYPSKDGLSVYFRDISERKHDEQEIKRINHALKTLSSCNKALIRATNEMELLQNICDIIVHVGDYCLAWVGFAEADGTKRVYPVARAGDDYGYVDTLTVTWDDSDYGQGPTGTAIRTNTLRVVRNVLTDPNYSPWRYKAVTHGFNSTIALPLHFKDHVVPSVYHTASLNIYATHPDAFDAAEIELLSELAADVVFGITALRVREEHSRTEEQLRFQKTLLECQTEAAIDGILITSPNRTWLLSNRRFLDMWGISEKVASLKSSDIAMAVVRNLVKDADHFIEKVMYLHNHHFASGWDEVALTDSRVFERYSTPITDNEQHHYGRVWFYRDISEHKRLYAQVREAHERLQWLSRRLIDIQETERHAIARELHDEIGQILTGLHLLIEMARRAVVDTNVSKKLDEAHSMVSNLLARVCEMSLNLRPAMLDDLGLLPTCRWYFNRYTSQTNIHVRF